VNSPAWSVGYQNEDETAPVRIYEGASAFDKMRDTCWNDDGTKLFLLRGIGGVDGLANAGTPFNPVSGDLSIAETLAVAGGGTANAIDFKPDGTAFWIGSSASGGSGGVLQYDMSTPWDVSTGVLGVSYVPTEAIISRGLRFDPSGRKFWVMDNVDNIREYSMTVDWDITSAVYVSVVDFSAYVPAGAVNNDGAWGFDVSPDGTVLMVFFFDAASGSDCQIARFTSDGGAFNAPIVDTFTVGDPAYRTVIDGTSVDVTTDVNVTGDITLSGDQYFDVSRAIYWNALPYAELTPAVGISSEWGSNLNTDWSSAGVVAATAALESTGILQDSSFGMDGFDVSDDGLHAIMCEQSGDRIVAYDLDSPYDFENATRTGAIHSGSGAFNPGDSLQWINDGASYMIVDLGGIVRIYNCPSPYVIDGPVGEAQSVSGATLGWSSGTTGFYMSRDGTKLVGSGNNGDSTYSVKIFELATPFVITTGRTLLSTYTYTGDTNAPNGSMSQTQLSADGLTLIFSYSTAEMKLGTMTVPFDVTTMTFSVNRNIQTDMTGNPWQVGHITPDGNSLYVYTDNATQGRVGKYTKDVLNPALQDSFFVVGDPTTGTQIDGTAVNITAPIDVAGNITLTGTVDGRDVAADGTAQDAHIALTNEHIDWTAATQDFETSGTIASTGQLIDLDNSAAATATTIMARNSAGGVTLNVNTTTGNAQIGQISGAGAAEDVWLNFTRNGQVDLRYDNSIKLSTASGGVTVTGDVGATSFNSVAITNGGVATNYLDETGNYSVPAGGGSASFDGLTGKTSGTGNYQTSGDMIADNFEATGLGPVSTPGAEDLYMGGYGIIGDRSAQLIYVTNANSNASSRVGLATGGSHSSAQVRLQVWSETATGRTSAGQIKDHGGTLRDIGFNTLPTFNFNASDTLQARHCGHATGKTNTTAYTLTGPADTDVDFPVGGVAHVYNLGTSVDYTISDTATCTMYFCDGSAAPQDIVGSCTLAPGGMVSLWRYSTTAIYITGNGITV
jgi:hypothetical protein